jgi:hypothetical protein
MMPAGATVIKNAPGPSVGTQDCGDTTHAGTRRRLSVHDGKWGQPRHAAHTLEPAGAPKRARLLLNQSPNRPIAVLVPAGTGSVVGNGYRSDSSGRARSTGCREGNSLGDVLRDGQV